MTIKINLNGIEVNVVRKSIKNIYLKIRLPETKIRISAPIQMNLTEIRNFALSKLDWIKKQQKKIKKKSYNYINDEIHFFRGEKYFLKIIENNSRFAKLDKNKILLYIPQDSILEERRSIINDWYKNQLFELIPPIIKKWEKILNVSVKNFCIRSMKTRWGSCTPKTRRIRFNLELAKVSPNILEYIVVHELMHLIEASHNKKFKNLMDYYYPNWKYFRNKLNKMNIFS